MDSPLRFTRVPALDVELLHTIRLTHHYPPHLHEEYSIGVVLHGTETITVGGVHVAGPGSVMIMNADEVHANDSADVEYITMKVRPRVMRRVAMELGGSDRPIRFPVPVFEDAEVFSSLRDLLLSLEEETMSKLEAESAFVTSMALLLPAPHRTGRGRIAIAREYLKSHFAGDVSLAELARMAELSPFHLLRVFREEVGVPPHEYQMQLRVAHARKLLRSGEGIADAALQTGFFDQSHLSRSFKRIVGMTPGRYAARSKIVQYEG